MVEHWTRRGEAGRNGGPRTSKPVRRSSPTPGRFDSCAVRITFAGAARRCASYDAVSDSFRLNLKTSRALAPGSYTLSARVYVGSDLVTTGDAELLIRD